LATSAYSNAQNNHISQIDIQIACGVGGVTSLNIDNIHRLVTTKTYGLLKRKLFSQNRTDALISVIALRELQSKRLIDLSPEELSQINTIVNWDDNYSVCHTCTQHFEGTVNELLTKNINPAYNLIKSAIFKSN
jgi:hypothetical protein